MDRSAAKDHSLAKYLEIRDRFLSTLDKTDDVQWLVEVGSFVRDRWLAEENERVPDEALDEMKAWHLWDECSEGHLRDIRVSAELQLKAYLAKGRVKAFLNSVREEFRPVQDVLKVLGWTATEVVKGFVGAVGLLIFGLLFVWLYPSVAMSLRKTLDEALPVASTQSTTLPSAGAP